MTDKPIIFSAPMIRALLDLRKWQTRRNLKPKWNPSANQDFSGWRAEQQSKNDWLIVGGMGVGAEVSTPYAVGDRLWVQENCIICAGDEHGPMEDPPVKYEVDGITKHDRLDYPFSFEANKMPRWASRLTLVVTDVRVQRVQEISAYDAQAEGIQPIYDPASEYGEAAWLNYLQDDEAFGGFAARRISFSTLWNSIHGPDAWDRNDWVAAYTFTVHKCNIDQMGAAA